MKRIGRKGKVLIAVAAALILLTPLLLWGNTNLGLTTYTLSEKTLPEAFDGFRIAHISDLHNTEIGRKNSRLLNMLREAEPDMIAITGDLVDSRDTNVDVAISFLKEAVKIAPCYYITGNHEVRLKPAVLDSLLSEIKQTGTVILDDREVVLQRSEDSIAVAGRGWSSTTGVDHFTFFEGYRILLNHTPEMFANCVFAGYDLVLSGHNHGGQVRIPFLGGLYAPRQGIFPKYDAGVFSLRETDMVVSRGIGNSSFPLRVNNPPELVLIILHCE